MARRPNKAADENAVSEDIDNMTDEELAAAMEAEAAGTVPDEDEAAAETEAEAVESDAAETETDEGTEAKSDDGDDGKEDMVPHGRFHRENERRKAAEERAERLERRLEALINTVGQNGRQEQPQTQQEQRDDPPNIEDDPAGYIQWQTRQIQRLEGALHQGQRTTEERSQTEALLHASNYDMQIYATEHPEAQEAYTWLSEQGRQVLAEQGIRDPHQQRAELNAWQVKIAQSAQQLGLRPAAMLMTLARENGWQPAARQQTTQATDPKKVVAEIDRQEATKAAARSMKDTGAAVDTGMPTAEQIDQMDDAEFDALLKKFGGDPDRMEAALAGVPFMG